MVCLRPFDTEAEAIALANDTRIGLAADVMSGGAARRGANGLAGVFYALVDVAQTVLTIARQNARQLAMARADLRAHIASVKPPLPATPSLDGLA